MSSRRIRKIAALVTAMVLAVGLTAHGVGSPEMAAGFGMNTAPVGTSMPADAPIPGKCKGCVGDEKGVAPAVCSAFCGAVMVLPAAPAILLTGPAETLNPVSEPDGISHIDPPEPHPPRTTLLS